MAHARRRSSTKVCAIILACREGVYMVDLFGTGFAKRREGLDESIWRGRVFCERSSATSPICGVPDNPSVALFEFRFGGWFSLRGKIINTNTTCGCRWLQTVRKVTRIYGIPSARSCRQNSDLQTVCICNLLFASICMNFLLIIWALTVTKTQTQQRRG